MQKLKQMTLFMTVVESGSITKAADKLDLSKSVISQHIKQLEADLGLPLLKRTTRKQSLTASGERFYLQCCEMHQLAEKAWSDILHQKEFPQGKLTVTAPHALMNDIIIPALSSVFSVHKDVKLNLIAHDGQLDLMQEDIDLAIRVGESKLSSLKQKRIGTIQDILCIAKNYPEFTSDNIEALPYVANHWQSKQISHQLVNTTTKNARVINFIAAHQVNTVQNSLSLIKNGFGIGLLPEFIYLQHQDELKEVLPTFEMKTSNVYALHPFHGQVPISVRMAIDAIERALA
ncbi:LysR family transcriptional regulator [Aliivibrio sifiae]|uniref:Transcriptional regulator n=1 Tax=Aliivibrio sifiae TaxID=566293 RepID=A0A2S7X999_9GAMM|nr:LysR family transcriptional regulator [Aliivibrio sifiae]PQJ87928.1 transcriptional regulator [Aliivibrio sifiae]GLR73571.1 transcriptional regulator [Aliivibrio sifiae]